MQRPLLRQTACLEPENPEVGGTVSFERSLSWDDGWICRREGLHGFGANADEKRNRHFLNVSVSFSYVYAAGRERLAAERFRPASDPFFLVLQLCLQHIC